VPICRALSAHGVPIAPRTYWARRSRPVSRRALADAAVTEILAGIYEPDERGRRKPESLDQADTDALHERSADRRRVATVDAVVQVGRPLATRDNELACPWRLEREQVVEHFRKGPRRSDLDDVAPIGSCPHDLSDDHVSWRL
jgi:hypothetical protein